MATEMLSGYEPPSMSLTPDNRKANPPMLINSLEEVRPGDLMIAGQNAAPAKLTVYLGQLLLGQQFRIGRLVAGHVAVVVPGGKIVEAMPHGARIRDLTPADWSDTHAYIRLPEDYVGQHLDAAAIAMAMIGTPYSIMSYVYIAAYLAGIHSERRKARINRRHQIKIVGLNKDLANGHGWGLYDIPVEDICSVLGEQAWTLTGKKVIVGTAPQVVTPGMLTQQLWTREGVIRGGVGIS